MRLVLVAVALLSQLLVAVESIRVIQSNDDGWAEQYVRSANQALKDQGHDVILSAPADNKSGTSSRDEGPRPRDEACQYESCPPGSGPVGVNETDSSLHWVNSFPVTSMRYGIDDLAPQSWSGEGPELAVSGPNVGPNVWLSVPVSGTVGAAVFAAAERDVPAIAFSGASSGNLAWDEPEPARSRVYGALAAKLVDALVEAGTPYLPEGVWLNVNFGRVDEQRCADPDEFVWIATRINPGIFSEPDAEHCGTNRLPREASILLRNDGCYVSVSVGDAADKSTAPASKQAPVLASLEGLLSCLP